VVSASRKEADPEEFVLLSLSTELRKANLLEMSDFVVDNRRAALGDLLDGMKKTLPELSNALTTRYFSHSEPSRQLTVLASFAS
jgi:hypothetical protein